MSPPEDQWRPPEQPPGRRGREARRAARARPRWMPWVIIGLIVAIFLVWQATPSTTPERAKLDYGTFIQSVKDHKVASIKYDSSNGKIIGKFAQGQNQDGKTEFTTQGPQNTLPDADIKTLNDNQVDAQLQAAVDELDRRNRSVGRAVRAARVDLVVHRPTRPRPDGRGHEHRPFARQGVQHRQAEDDVRATSRATAR